MFIFHRLLKIRDPQWSADMKQKSTRKLTCSPASLPSFFHTQKRRIRIIGECSVRLNHRWKLPCVLLLSRALEVRGLPHLHPKKVSSEFCTEMSDDDKDLHFQTMQARASFSFWKDVWKFTDWNLHIWATWHELAKIIFQIESPI